MKKLWLALGALSALLVLAQMSYGATSAPSRSNSLEAYIPDDNTNVYTYGVIVDTASIEDRFLNITVQPAYTPELHKEQVLICGSSFEWAKIDHLNLHSPMVMTYERIAHRTVHGIGCHNIVSVDYFKETK